MKNIQFYSNKKSKRKKGIIQCKEGERFIKNEKKTWKYVKFICIKIHNAIVILRKHTHKNPQAPYEIRKSGNIFNETFYSCIAFKALIFQNSWHDEINHERHTF